MSPPKKPHRNSEKVVKCPVGECDAEKLARGIHLHVLQSVGNNHGEQGEIPEDISLENLEEVGTQEVEVNYPKERKVEKVARLCPYCKKPFVGSQGVLIHLGQIAGRKNHPANASRVHVPEDFPVVELDDNENIVGVVDSRPVTDIGEDSSESESGERRAFAELSKAEIDYLYQVVRAETDDEGAKRILRRAMLIPEK